MDLSLHIYNTKIYIYVIENVARRKSVCEKLTSANCIVRLTAEQRVTKGVDRARAASTEREREAAQRTTLLKQRERQRERERESNQMGQMRARVVFICASAWWLLR